VEFFHEHGQMRARLRFNLIGLVGSGSPLPAFYGEQALATAKTATRPATSSTCSTIACNG
jgi:predicted component of type VI protein secretion system